MSFRLLVSLLALLAAGAAGFVGGHKWVSAEWNAEKAAQAVAALEQSENNRETERHLARANAGVIDAYVSRMRAAQARDAVARSELDRLRDAIAAATARADATEASERFDEERIQVFGRLLGEAAGLAAEGGERVGRLDAQVSALQGFVRDVCMRGAK